MAASTLLNASWRKSGSEYEPFLTVREGCEGKVAWESEREMMVIWKLLVARRAFMISEPMVPLAWNYVNR